MKALQILVCCSLTLLAGCFKYPEIPSVTPTFEITNATRSYRDAIQTKDGNYVAVGAAGATIVVEKFDRNGELLWSNTELLPSGASSGFANSVKETADGELLVVAKAENRGALFKCNSQTGDKIASYEFNIDNNLQGFQESSLLDVLVLANGELAVLGHASKSPDTDSHFLIFSLLTDTGNSYRVKNQWKELNTPGDAFSNSTSKTRIKSLPSGGFVVVSPVAEGFSAYSILKILDAGGNSSWEFSYKNEDVKVLAYDVAVHDGNFYIVGNALSSTEGNYLGCISATTQEETWQQVFGASPNDFAKGIAVRPDGKLAIVGSQNNGIGNALTVFIADPATREIGNPKLYNGLTENQGDSGESVTVTADGGLIISGYTYDSNGFRHGYLLKTTADGEL